MRNLIKAQIYQLKKSKFTLVLFFIILVMQSVMLFGEVAYRDGMTAGACVAEMGYFMSMVAVIFAIAFTGEICGADFIDKTANYELMNGYLRKEIYFGRVILSLIGGGIGAALLLAGPIMIVAGINGWGSELELKTALFRYFLSLFPVFRIICGFIFLSYIVKNSYVIMAGGFLTCMAGSNLMGLFGNPNSVLLGITNLLKLYSFASWNTYTLVDSKTYIVYEAVLSANDVLATIFVSVGIGALFLLLGYTYFKKDDLR